MTSGKDGLVIVDKPGGMTSHDVVARIRRLAGTRRVGHAGTLDPMATGVLVVGVEKATRLLGYLALTEKQYDATIRLGQSTSTDDAEGEVTGGASAEDLSAKTLAETVKSLTGEIAQVPPAVSAIKVDGQRAYKLTRAGAAPDLKPRPVTVYEFTVTAIRPAEGDLLDVDATVRCSSGTYIRALARDLGSQLGVGVPGLGDQFLNPLRAVGQGVGDEGQRRGVPQADLPAHLGPDDAGRAGQRHGRVGPFGVSAEHRVVHGRFAQVVREPSLGDGHEAEPGVLDPSFQHFRDDLADPVGELACPGGIHAPSLLLVEQPLPGRQQLDLRMSGHQAFALGEHAHRVRGRRGHHGYPDLGPLVQVQVAGLGHRDARVAPAQLGDERPDDGTFRLQRVHVAQQQVERQRRDIHRRLPRRSLGPVQALGLLGP